MDRFIVEKVYNNWNPKERNKKRTYQRCFNKIWDLGWSGNLEIIYFRGACKNLRYSASMEQFN